MWQRRRAGSRKKQWTTGGWGGQAVGGRRADGRAGVAFSPFLRVVFCKSFFLSRCSALRVSPAETRLTVYRRLSIIHLLNLCITLIMLTLILFWLKKFGLVPGFGPDYGIWIQLRLHCGIQFKYIKSLTDFFLSTRLYATPVVTAYRLSLELNHILLKRYLKRVATASDLSWGS